MGGGGRGGEGTGMRVKLARSSRGALAGAQRAAAVKGPAGATVTECGNQELCLVFRVRLEGACTLVLPPVVARNLRQFR